VFRTPTVKWSGWKLRSSFKVGAPLEASTATARRSAGSPNEPFRMEALLIELSTAQAKAGDAWITPAFTCKARLNDGSRSEHTSAPCLVQ
jgi:hypothetical protein